MFRRINAHLVPKPVLNLGTIRKKYYMQDIRRPLRLSSFSGLAGGRAGSKKKSEKYFRLWYFGITLFYQQGIRQH